MPVIITSQRHRVRGIYVIVPSCKIFPNILTCHSVTVSISRNLVDPLRMCMLGWNSKLKLTTFVQECGVDEVLLGTCNQFHVDLLHLSKSRKIARGQSKRGECGQRAVTNKDVLL